MGWFAAHGIFYFKLESGPQDRYTIWENVYLFEAPSAEEALASANAWAKEVEAGNLDSGFTENGQPALLVFAGIRKLISVSHESAEGEVRSRDEITYSEFVVPDEASIERLVNGEDVQLTYVE